MRLIRMAVAGFALCVGASAAEAQGTPPSGAPQSGTEEPSRGMRRGGVQAALFEGVTLTESQQKQVDAIRSKYMEQRRALRPDGEGKPDETARTKMKDLRKAETAEIRAVLSAEQQVVFDRNAAEMQKRRTQRGAART